MIAITLAPDSDFKDWQPIARQLLLDGHHYGDVQFCCGGQSDLFSNPAGSLNSEYPRNETNCSETLRLPRAFVDAARFAASHQQADRFDLLYRLMWRLHHQDKTLMQNALDRDAQAVLRLAKQVGRDYHKMKAFVRFKELTLKDINPSDDDRTPKTVYVAWFEPGHYIVRLASDFFVKRFHSMDWSIVTPYQSVHWIDQTLTFGQGSSKDQTPTSDDFDTAWQVYYASIFNPARLKVNAMCAEMPKKYWHNLPEARLIPSLIQRAPIRTQTMLEQAPTQHSRLPQSSRFDRQQWLRLKQLPPTD